MGPKKLEIVNLKVSAGGFVSYHMCDMKSDVQCRQALAYILRQARSPNIFNPVEAG